MANIITPVKNSLQLLKKNPLLILLYFLYSAITGFLVLSLIPGQMDETSLVDLMIFFVQLVVLFFASVILGLLFLSGFGAMLGEAVMNGKTSLRTFFSGIGKFVLKLLLAGLLFLVLCFAFSLVLGILMIPLGFLMAMNGGGDVQSYTSVYSVSVAVLSTAATLFVMPFIALWYPALFLDPLGVVQTLKRGVRVGVKNYGTLLLWTGCLYLPTLIYTLMGDPAAAQGFTITPLYIVILLLSALLSLIYFPALFLLYAEKRQPMLQDFSRPE